MYDWVTLLYSKSWHDIMYQLYFKKKKQNSNKSLALPGSHENSDCNSVVLGWGMRLCISHKLSEDAKAADPRPHLE